MIPSISISNEVPPIMACHRRRDFNPDGTHETYTLNQRLELEGTSCIVSAEFTDVCEYKAGKKHGKYTRLRKDNTKQIEGEYKDDKLDGTLTEWQHDGVVYVRTYLNGELQTETCYDHGDRLYLQEYENGHPIKKTSFRGDLRFVTELKEGQWHGLRTFWYDPDHKEQEWFYVQGMKHGKNTEWYHDGTVRRECEYVDDKIQGTETHWFQRGLKKMVCQYKDDVVISVDYALDDQFRDCILRTGNITVWKSGLSGEIDVYIQLAVPHEARRTTTPHFWSKIEYGTVIQIVDKAGKKYTDAVGFDRDVFHVGETVRSRNYDPRLDTACYDQLWVYKYREQCD